MFFRVPTMPSYLNFFSVDCFRLNQFFSAGRLQLEQFFLEGGFLCLLDWKANKTRGVNATVRCGIPYCTLYTHKRTA